MAAPATSIDTLHQAFSEHEGFVRQRLRGLGVPPQFLDDAAQDVFEVLVRRIGDYDPERPFVPWMAGVARKVAKRHRERGQRQPLALVSEPADAPRSDPERAAMTDEARRKFDRFLDRLTPQQWEVFVLSEIEGLKGTEISEELGVNLSTVYARLRKAKKQLRRATGPSRNWLPAWVPFVGLGRKSGSATPVVGGVIGGGLALSLGLGMCATNEEESSTPRSAEVEPSVGEVASAAAVGGVAARPADAPARDAKALAVASTEARAPENNDGWVPQSSGVSTEGDGTLSRENHTRITGDVLELRITYVGDDDEAMSRSLVRSVPDGFRVVVPPPEHVEIPAGEEVQVYAKLEATRPGAVHWEYAYGFGASSTGATLSYVNDNGKLRKCEPHECDREAAPLTDSGKVKTVEIENECGERIRFALVAEHGKPPEGTEIHVFGTGDKRTMTMDEAAHLVVLDEAGNPTYGLATSGDGEIRFYDDDQSKGCAGTARDAGAGEGHWSAPGDADEFRAAD